MNRIFNLKWSPTHQTHVACSELTRRAKKTKRLALASAMALIGLLNAGSANAADAVCSASITGTNGGCSVTTSLTPDVVINPDATVIAPTNSTNWNAGITYDSQSFGNSFGNYGIVSGTNYGLFIYNSSRAMSVTNGGSLLGNFAGLELSATNVGDIINSGTIRGGTDTSSYQSFGIEASNGVTIGNLTNTSTGVIWGNSRGIELEGGTEVKGAITNYGTIQGGTTGLQIDAQTTLDNTTITNYGTLEGGSYAFYSKNTQMTTLNQAGGALIGDIYGSNTTLEVSASSFEFSGAFYGWQLIVDQGASMKISSTKSVSGLIGDGINALTGVNNSGTIEIASGTTATINGDYTQNSSGILKIDVASDSSYGKLVVSGTATLPSNAQITVNASNPNYAFTSAYLTGILSANNLVSDGTFKVTDNSLLFDFSAIINNNAIDLKISASSSNASNSSGSSNSSSTGNESVYKSVMNNNQKNAAGAAVVLDSLVTSYASNSTTGNSDMDTVVTNLGSLSTEAEVAAATSKTLPLLNGQAPTAIQTQLQTNQNVIAGRLDSTRGLSSGDSMLASGNAWLKVYSTRSTQHDRDGVSGYLAQTSGGVLGIDGDLAGKDLTLGAAFGFNKSHVSQNNGLHTASIDNYQGVIYGSKKLASNLADFVDFQADLGYQNISGDRTIQFSEINRVAHADYNGYSYHLGSSVGKNIQITDRVKIQPVIGLDYTFVKSNGYTENGADSLDLIVGSQKAKQLLYSAGTKWDVKINDKTTFYGKVAVAYDQYAESNSILASYAGDSSSTFVTTGTFGLVFTG